MVARKRKPAPLPRGYYRTQNKAFERCEHLHRIHGVCPGVIQLAEDRYKLTFDPIDCCA